MLEVESEQKILDTPNTYNQLLLFSETNEQCRIKINLDLALACLNMQDNNRYNICIQFSIQYQDCGVQNIKNLGLY